jgi:hypothetical protein
MGGRGTAGIQGTGGGGLGGLTPGSGGAGIAGMPGSGGAALGGNGVAGGSVGSGGGVSTGGVSTGGIGGGKAGAGGVGGGHAGAGGRMAGTGGAAAGGRGGGGTAGSSAGAGGTAIVGSGGMEASGGTPGTGGVEASGGTPGTGGMEAAGGSAGMGAAGGTTGSAGTAGSATGGGAAGSGVAGSGAGGGGAGGTGTPPCPGCVVLSVPVTDGDSLSTWGITLDTAADLSASTITFRMCVATSQTDTTIFQPFVANAGANLGTYGFQTFDNSFQDQTTGTLSACSSGLSDIVLNPVSIGFDAKTVSFIGFSIGSKPGSTGPWSNPTVVRLDSITVSNASGVGPYTFDTSTDPLLMGNPYAAGTTFTWVSM